MNLYPLDWKTQEVRLAEGRFVHTVRRPTPEEIFERDREMQSEIPIGRDGSYKLPDPTATEDLDVKLYDKIVETVKGYPDVVPAAHKSAVITGLYRREIYVDEDADIFAEEVAVIEEIGSGDEPDFVITHVMRQPTEDELRMFRRRNGPGEVKPGKRGKQIFVTKSNLRLMTEYYDLWIEKIEGVKIESDVAAEYTSHVDPLIKRQVVLAFTEKLAGGLLD